MTVIFAYKSALYNLTLEESHEALLIVLWTIRSTSIASQKYSVARKITSIADKALDLLALQFYGMIISHLLPYLIQ